MRLLVIDNKKITLKAKANEKAKPKTSKEILDQRVFEIKARTKNGKVMNIELKGDEKEARANLLEALSK